MLKHLGLTGPLAVSMYAHSLVFYWGGVVTDCSTAHRTDHVVQMIGYGSDDGEEYWLLRNSWGSW